MVQVQTMVTAIINTGCTVGNKPNQTVAGPTTRPKYSGESNG